MSETQSGTATVVINCSPAEAFAAVADVTRMGEWSPENTACRWVGDASGPAVGAEFEGDNEAKLGPIPLKKWTTTSAITECVPGEVFEFVAEGNTTWRYDFAATDDGTRVTESFSHPPYAGMQKLVYGIIAQRDRAMIKGMQATLDRLKVALEQ